MNQNKLIEEARKTVALITSYTKDTAWSETFPLKYRSFQDRAEKLNEALGENRFDWDKELKND